MIPVMIIPRGSNFSLFYLDDVEEIPEFLLPSSCRDFDSLKDLTLSTYFSLHSHQPLFYWFHDLFPDVEDPFSLSGQQILNRLKQL